jgi:hypothetical protein
MKRLLSPRLLGLLVLVGFAAGTHAATSLTVFPQSLNLGVVQAGIGTAPAVMTLTDTGTTDASFGIIYPYPPDSVLPSANCFRDGQAVFVIHPAESCELGLDLAVSSTAPSDAIGSGTSILQIVVNGGVQIVPVSLQWKIVPTYLEVDDVTPIQFPPTQLGLSSAPIMRAVRNNTDAQLDIVLSWDGLLGPECSGRVPSPLCQAEMARIPSSFIIDSAGCHPIPAHGACTLSITFAPRDAYLMNPDLLVSAPDTSGAVTRYLNLSGLGIPKQTVPGTALAVEFVNNELGQHYFMTADPAEIAALDTHQFNGWMRTGRSFWVFPSGSGQSKGANPVCRFYGRPEAGLDSHIYSASVDECAVVQAKFSYAWLLESNDVFEVFLPDPATGACAPRSAPVYRVYNNRSDVNHRYITDPDVRNFMVSTGWVAEGYGANAVAMCAPQ